MASFIWDKMLATGWDQSLLTPTCSKCHTGILRITYEFPRSDKVVLQVMHIVGLKEEDDDYVAMMWETQPQHSPAERWFDFKYQRGRNPRGLNKPVVFSRENLHDLFEIYRKKTGVQIFP